MTEHDEVPELPFNTSAEAWALMTPEQRTALMQMEMGEAQARHAAHRAEAASADVQTWGAAQATVRLLMALNAGALVAILAFLGSMIAAKEDLWLPPLILSLAAFLAGALVATGASAVAFFAGSMLTQSLQGDILTTKYPYVLGTKRSNELIDNYNLLRWIGIWMCALSGLCTLIGSGAFLNFAIVALQT